MKIIIKLGGIYHIICGILHIAQPKLLRWEEIFTKFTLTPVEYSYITTSLYIINYVLMFFWFILGAIWLIYSEEMLQKGIGRLLLISMVLFWIFRIFVLQTIYIGYNEAISFQMAGFFFIGLMLMLIPLISSLRKKETV